MGKPGKKSKKSVDVPQGGISLDELLDCSSDTRKLKGDLTQRKTTNPQQQKPAQSSKLSSNPGASIEYSKLATLTPGYDLPLPLDKMGTRKVKKLRKEERDKTKGSAWFNMPGAEMTKERKNDLEALSLRGALDKKRFYKRNNMPVRPKYFQVGRIIEAPADFYHSRVPKRQRKATIADEMAAEMSDTLRG